jgi:hypothetical protein
MFNPDRPHREEQEGRQFDQMTDIIECAMRIERQSDVSPWKSLGCDPDLRPSGL